MFHKATKIQYREGTTLQVVFQDGMVKRFDMSTLFSKYPQLLALKDRKLFLSGKLQGPYGIIWNDDLDITVDTIYEEGTTVEKRTPAPNVKVGEAVASARAMTKLSQHELSLATGIDQSDISKIERGVANPSVNTLRRIAKALNTAISITIE